MASKTVKSSDRYEPQPRFAHISQSVGRGVAVQGGQTKNWSEESMKHLTAVVEVLDLSSETWEQKKVAGHAPPPGTQSAASAILQGDLFTFGGWNGRQYFNTLRRLNFTTWRWVIVASPQNTPGAPTPKRDCGMVAFGAENLAVFGGYGTPQQALVGGETRRQQAVPSFVKSRATTDNQGWLNELHTFNLAEGSWGSPAMTGDVPPPCSDLTLTAVDSRRAVLFGGCNGEQGHMNDTFIIDFVTMKWTKLPRNDDDPWPEKRASAAACCLNFGQRNPQLLVTGGVNAQRKPLGDAWVLDIEKGNWRKEAVSFEPRWGHSLTACSLATGLTEVTMFGGSLGTWGSEKKQKLTGTTLLQFRLADSGWKLHSTVKSSQLGSQERVVEKIRYVAAVQIQEAVCKTILAEGERDRAREEKREALERVRVLEGERERDREEKREALERVRVLEGERGREREEKEAALERVRVLEGERGRDQESQGRVRRERSRVESERDRALHDLQQAQVRVSELQGRLDVVEQRERERQVVLEQAAAAESRGPSWIVRRDELEVTEQEIGCGGWGKVKVAKLKVAAKILHSQLTYNFYQQLFRREMDMAARISHPNLLRFLGARLEGGMAILTEFMPTSLRELVTSRQHQRLPKEHILSIATDVASALNYLHSLLPEPIIHRDLSSGNVLLQPSPSGGWLAKVSDYGSANFQSQLHTMNPGCPAYTAPEASNPSLQTAKMDIYSFGVLLVEMCTCDFPVPERRTQLIESIRMQQMVNLICQCVYVDKDQRPTAAQLVNLLKAMN